MPPPHLPHAPVPLLAFRLPHREAAVHGMGSVASLRALRRQAAAAGLNPKPKLVGPRPQVAEGPCWDKRLGAWTLPFPGEEGRREGRRE